MTVKELIKHLKKFDGDDYVSITNDGIIEIEESNDDSFDLLGVIKAYSNKAYKVAQS